MAKRAAPRDGIRPQYELRAKKRGPGNLLLEVWQLPSVATPEIKEPYYVGGLSGRNLALVEHRLFKQIRCGRRHRDAEVRGSCAPGSDEDLALRLGLSFRALAPMRNRLYMRGVSEGIDAMAKEEAAYWLGMAMHRRRPRRVLAALRCLLVE
jgi:hypothetical protein